MFKRCDIMRGNKAAWEVLATLTRPRTYNLSERPMFMSELYHDTPRKQPSLPATSGIYKITCTANKKIYIGSALNLRKRKWQHFCDLRRGNHSNIHLQRAWNKHTESAFTFEVMELVLPMNTTAREQYWLDKLKPFGRKGFNLARDAASPGIGRKHTPEELKKMKGRERSPQEIENHRRSMSGHKPSAEVIDAARCVNLGKKQSPDHIEKLRQLRTGKKFSLVTRERMRQAQLIRWARERDEFL